jgi:nicotinate-nucleotide adenylyltransferase
MAQSVALYGGSFDPIHFGHLIGARQIAEHFSIERVVLIPSARPPHKLKRPMTEARHRLEMTRLAVAGDSLFEVDDLELHREGPSYSIDTVFEYRRRLGPDAELYWLLGSDSLPELVTWHRAAELVKAVRMVTFTRPGWTAPDERLLAEKLGYEAAAQLLRDCVPTAQIDISATAIRDRVRAGKPIRYLVPESVASYISAHCLYG